MVSEAQAAGIKQWASTSNTFAGAGTQSKTATLPGGATGRPVLLRASGSVSGEVDLTIGNGAIIAVPVNPNAPYTDAIIPASAFVSAVGEVTLSLVGDGAGVIRCLVGFV